MAIAVAADQLKGSAYTFGVCPNWTNNACACPRDLGGAPIPPHTVFTFQANPPAHEDGSPDDRTQQEWLRDCAIEGMRIVKQNTTAAVTPPIQSNTGQVLS